MSASNAENKDVLWGFIDTYAPGTTAETHPFLDRLTDYALAYYRDFVAPNKTYRAASGAEKTALDDLLARLEALLMTRMAKPFRRKFTPPAWRILKKICAAGFRAL